MRSPQAAATAPASSWRVLPQGVSCFTRALPFRSYRSLGSARTGQFETTPYRPSQEGVSEMVRPVLFIVASLFVCGPAFADQGGDAAVEIPTPLIHWAITL